MTNLEREELSRRASAMTDEELEVIANYIPSKIMLAELEKRSRQAQITYDLMRKASGINRD